MGIEGVSPHYQIILSKKGSLDSVEVRVELANGFDFDEVKQLESIARRVRAEITSALAISLDVKLVEPKSIARSQGKAQRIVDLRQSGE